MSLYDRLDLTRPNRRKFKSAPKQDKPIGQRIDLTRPEKPKCQVCRNRIQTTWRICPHCGWILQSSKTKRHCIWVQVCNLEVYGEERELWLEILADAFSQVFSAFRSVNVFLTTDPPNQKDSESCTQVYVLVDNSSVDYL